MKVFPFLTALLLASTSWGQAPRGMVGQKAPAWDVDEWVQLAGKPSDFDLKDLEGRVVYLYCFQSWCPGCHKHGFPTLGKIIEVFGEDEEVEIVTVQTTFEGHSINSTEAARKTAEKYNLQIPVGQSGSKEKRSAIMQRYRTGGTPWTIIIDKEGIVRYNNFHIDSEKAVSMIKELKEIP